MTSKQTMVILAGAVVLVAAAAVVGPKLLRPTVAVSVPSPDLQKQVDSLLTPSNMAIIGGLANAVLSNVAAAQVTTVIVSNPAVPSPVLAAPPSNTTPTTSSATPSPASPATIPVPGGPSLELFLMDKNHGLPSPGTAPIAKLADTKDLFCAARFKDDPRLLSYQRQNLWLKWQGRLSTPTAGMQTFFHTLHMNRMVQSNAKKRPTDYRGRGKQKVFSHIYIDNVKCDSKEKRFAEIQGSDRSQFSITLGSGVHTVEIWLGIIAENAPHVYDETAVTLEMQGPNQPTATRLTAADLAL